MPSPESNFVPINEASSDRVRFNIDLPPYIDRTQIRANIPRIERLMRIGGINHLRVETFEGDQVSESPTIVGFDSQGNAYAGKTGATTIPKEFEVDSAANSHRGSPTADVKIKLDIRQINESIVNEGVRASREWARKIDKGVTTGLRNSGNKILLVENFKKNIFAGGTQAIILPIDIALQDLNNLIFSLVWFSGVLQGGYSMLYKGRHRWSILLGSQLDRAALLQVRSRLQRVVKASDELK